MRMLIFLFLSLTATNQAFASAEHVPVPEDSNLAPQIQWDGTGVGTLKGVSEDHASHGLLDFSDSALIFGASEALYGDGIGAFSLGMESVDSTLEGAGNPLFVHHAFVSYQTKSIEVSFGRMHNPIAQLIDFPTIRADDLITFTSYLNPFSNGAITEEHRYSNVGSITFNQDLSTFENIHVQHLLKSGPSGGEARINSFGLTVDHLGALPDMEALARVVMWGVGFEHVLASENLSHDQHVVFGGIALNLNKSVVHRIELRLQDIYTFGSELSQFQNLSDTFSAGSNAASASLRYLNSPFGAPGYQLALTAGYRHYPKISEAQSYGTALTGVKRLGKGFDLVGQYSYQWRAQNLANQYGGSAFEHTVEVGFAFNFESTMNKHLNPRRSLLNTQHQYVPY